jgi:hypothetical protein
MEIEEYPLQDATPSDLEVEAREDDAQNSEEYKMSFAKLAVANDEETRIAHEIAVAVNEADDGPTMQIARIVAVLGEAVARELLADTLKIEEAGGMLTNSGERRRTPGGVYFYLAKGRMTPEQRGLVFPHLAPRVIPSMAWDDRHEHVAALLSSEPNDRRLRTAIIQLRGFVADWKQIENSVVLKMVYAHRADIPLPRAVPAPPVDSPTAFIVYVGNRHWDKVEKIVLANADPLVIEGIPFFDQETNSLAVLALFVSSQEMMAKERRELIGEQAQAEMAPKPTRQEQKRQAEARKAEAAKKAEGASKSASSLSGSKIPVVKPASKPPKAASTPPPPKASQEPVAESAPPSALPVPSGMPADIAAKLQQLHQAAHTLRERIAAMETKKQPGIAMTRKLLENTEKQIETLMKQYM